MKRLSAGDILRRPKEVETLRIKRREMKERKGIKGGNKFLPFFYLLSCKDTHRAPDRLKGS